MVGAHTQEKKFDKSKVTAQNLGQIGRKQDRATEVCSLHIARSDGEAEPHGVARKATSDDCPDGQCRSRMRRQDGLKCEQLQKMKYAILAAIFLFNSCGFNTSGTSGRYYCQDGQEMAWHDDLVVTVGDRPRRKIKEVSYRELEFYRTYDEGDTITTIYVYRGPPDKRHYRILRLELSPGQITFAYGHGYHDTRRGFEKGYQVPPTPKALAYYNKNPELIPFLPPRPADKELSWAFLKDPTPCTSMGHFESFFKSMLLLIIQGMSAAG